MDEHPQTISENGKAYDSLAYQYDEVMDGTPYYFNIRETERHVLSRVLDEADVNCVVDVGCGTGFASIIAAGKGKDVLGIDPCPRMLAVAREKARDLRTPVQFLCANAEALPAEAREADLVVAFGSVLNHCDDWEAFFGGLRKAVRPHGHVAITVDNLLGLDSFTWAAFRLVTGHLDGVRDLYHRATAWWRKREHHNHWPLETPTSVVSVRLRYERPSRVLSLLTRYGFQVRRVEGSNIAASFSPGTVLSSAHLRTPTRGFGVVGRLLAWLDRRMLSGWWMLAGTYVVWAQAGNPSAES